MIVGVSKFGHGLIRLGVNAQRRTRQPYGMEGGAPGVMGRNTWIKQARASDGDLNLPDLDPSHAQPEAIPPASTADDKENAAPQGKGKNQKSLPPPRHINIGGKASVWMGKGDRLLIETPGAGAWGALSEGEGAEDDHGHVKAWAARGSLAEREAAQAGF